VPEHALNLGMSCQTLASLHALAEVRAVIEYADRPWRPLGPLARNKHFPTLRGWGALVQRATARMKLGRLPTPCGDWDRVSELDGGKTRRHLLDRRSCWPDRATRAGR
jgi:hypothetical protein